ncbi:MAG: ABC transporter substrate-binding protein [Proteobacteria bacterium]|nr:ABC transporter substrate-binding protein [Pseudomonadota bacterium]
MRNKFALSVCSIAMMVISAPVNASMKDGTLTVGLLDSYSHINPTISPGAEMQVMHRSLFDTLMNFDKKTGKFLPSLALSFKRVDATTWEYKLREDVKWHDGQQFTAEDVAYSINWAVDPKNKFPAKLPRFGWAKRAEAISKFTVRIVTKRPFAPTPARLAVTWPMLPKHAHSKYKKQGEFGKKPIGTGPYKAVSVDKNNGVEFVVNKAFNLQNAVVPTPTIQRVRFKTVPDSQSQVAELLTGGLDVTRVFTKDLADQLAANPNLSATAVNSFRYYFLRLDAAGRSGVDALKDIRVRRAIAHAIPREELRTQVISGGKAVIPIDALCAPGQVGCTVSKLPLKFNLAKAKALMKEAGYEDGFSLTISSLAESVSVNQAIIGYLREIGIRASLQRLPIVAFRKVRAQGKFNASVGIYGSGGIPDVSPVFTFYFSGKGRPRDYAFDDVVTELGKKAISVFDPAARNEMYRQAYNRINEQVYVIPFATAPTNLIHTKDLIIPNDFSTNAYGLPLAELKWRK